MAGLVQTKGLARRWCSAMLHLIAACRSTPPGKERRCNRCRLRAEKMPSTAFNHEAEVGVTWKVKPRVAGKPGAPLRVYGGGNVVEDGVVRLAE